MFRTKAERLPSAIDRFIPQYLPPEEAARILPQYLSPEKAARILQWERHTRGGKTWHSRYTAGYLRSIIDRRDADPDFKYGKRSSLIGAKLADLTDTAFAELKEARAGQEAPAYAIDMDVRFQEVINRLHEGNHRVVKRNSRYIAAAHCW